MAFIFYVIFQISLRRIIQYIVEVDFSYTAFAGPFPRLPVSIINLIAESAFFDSLDNSQFVGCNDLTYIEFGRLSFDNPLPTLWKDLGVTFIYVNECGITGSLDNLADPSGTYKPIEIWIDRNNDMTGTIPKELGHTQVASYSFTENNLSGTIPTEFGKMIDLQYLWLYGNSLTGTIPTELAMMVRTQFFRVEEKVLSVRKV